MGFDDLEISLHGHGHRHVRRGRDADRVDGEEVGGHAPEHELLVRRRQDGQAVEMAGRKITFACVGAGHSRLFFTPEVSPLELKMNDYKCIL